MRPRYFARSPRSICIATKFMGATPLLNAYWDVNGVHRVANFFGSSLADPLNENVHHSIDQAIRFNERKITRDQQRGHAVCACPNCLSYFFRVVAVKLPRPDAVLNGGAQVIEASLARLRLMVVRYLLCLYKRNNIMVGIVDTELNVSSQAAPQ